MLIGSASPARTARALPTVAIDGSHGDADDAGLGPVATRTSSATSFTSSFTSFAGMTGGRPWCSVPTASGGNPVRVRD